MGLPEGFRQGNLDAGLCAGPKEEHRGTPTKWLKVAACQRVFSDQYSLLVILSLLLLVDFGRVEARQWYESRASANMSVAVYESFHQTGHNCVHDSHMVPRIIEIHRRRHRSQEVRNIMQQGDQGQPKRRLLAEPKPAPIRIVPSFNLSGLMTEHADYIQYNLVPTAIRWLERAIKVKRPVVGPLKLELECQQWQRWNMQGLPVYECPERVSPTCLDAVIDPAHLNNVTTCDRSDAFHCVTTPSGPGVKNADLIVYITSKATPECGASTAAHAGACMFDPDTDRPLAGNINFCPGYFSETDSNNPDGELMITLHEMTHVLAFSDSLFPYFRDENGDPRVPRADSGWPDSSRYFSEQGPDVRAVVGTFQERGTTVRKIVTPQVIAMGRAHFGCSKLNGVELENGGGPSTAGSHWEARILHGEIMEGASQVNTQAYSNVTLALLDDSGWYAPDYGLGMFLRFGRLKGCDFAYKSCSSSAGQAVFSEYQCAAGGSGAAGYQCTYDAIAVGYCDGCGDSPTDSGSCTDDGCQRVIGWNNYGCTAPLLGQMQTDAVSVGMQFGPASRCFQHGSDPWIKKVGNSNAQSAGCYPQRCVPGKRGAPPSLYVEVAPGAWLQCVDNVEVELPRKYFARGTIGPCPAAADFCMYNMCPDDCSGKGHCYNGTCHCFPSYAGYNCGQPACVPSDCANGTVCDSRSGLCKVPGTTGEADSPAQPPITAPVVSNSGGESMLMQVTSTVRFSGGMASTQQQYTTFQNNFDATMTQAAHATGYGGKITVTVNGINQGSGVSVDSTVAFGPASGANLQAARDAAAAFANTLSNDPASIFAKNTFFDSFGDVTSSKIRILEANAGTDTWTAKIPRTVLGVSIKYWFIALGVLCLLIGATVSCWRCCSPKRRQPHVSVAHVVHSPGIQSPVLGQPVSPVAGRPVQYPPPHMLSPAHQDQSFQYIRGDQYFSRN
ncbi:Leishmanolysin-like peptidase [Klebsormidium nitens]|uniref:Leishmanolysin-like peptidase n=1 Tax=Klebsormidium nitens TaxID=105231 RepID=A0A1Y1I789_KLENI|nr:Leishmanolysin-like peptidase [Klebsormidium nitens]|eukprot:GAQ86824.1 Leishmanolysin-like peptidase [Klebsormidium nitens]